MSNPATQITVPPVGNQGMLAKLKGLVTIFRGKKKAKEMDLGDKNQFVFDEKLNRWMIPGQQVPEDIELPPPPIKPSTEVNVTKDSRSGIRSRYAPIPGLNLTPDSADDKAEVNQVESNSNDKGNNVEEENKQMLIARNKSLEQQLEEAEERASEAVFLLNEYINEFEAKDLQSEEDTKSFYNEKAVMSVTLQTKEKEIKEYKDRIVSLEKEVEDLKQERENYLQIILRDEDQSTAKDEVLSDDEDKEQFVEHNNKLIELEEELFKLKRKLKEYEQIIKESNEKITPDEFNNELTKLKNELSEREETISNLKKTTVIASELQKEINALRDEALHWKTQYQLLQEKLNALLCDVNSKDQVIEKLSANILVKDNKIEDIVKSIAKIQSELNESKVSLKRTEELCLEKTHENDKLKKDLDKLEKEYSETKQNLASKINKETCKTKDYSEEIKTLKHEFDNEKSKLQEQLNYLNHEHKNSVMKLELRIKELNEILELERKESQDKLAKEVQSYEDSIEGLKVNTQELVETNKKLQAEYDEFIKSTNNEKSELEQRLKEYNNVVEEHEVQDNLIKQCKEEIQKLNNLLNDKQIKFNKELHDLQELNKDSIQKLQSEIKELIVDKERMKSEFEVELKKYKDIIEELKKSTQELKEKNINLENEHNICVEEFNRNINKLKDNNSKSDLEKIKHLNDKVKEDDKAIDGLRKDVERLNDDIEELKNVNEALENEKVKSVDFINGLNESIKNLKKTIEDQRQIIIELKIKKENLENSIRKVQEENERHKESITQLEISISQLNNAIENKEQHILQLKKNIENIKEINNDFDSKKIQFQLEFKMYKDSIEELKLITEGLKRKNNRLESDLAKSQDNANKELQCTKDLLQSHIKKLKEENNALKVIIETSKSNSKFNADIAKLQHYYENQLSMLYSQLSKEDESIINCYEERNKELANEIILAKSEITQLNADKHITNQILKLVSEKILQISNYCRIHCGINNEINLKNYAEFYNSLESITKYIKELESVKLIIGTAENMNQLLDASLKESEAKLCRQILSLEEKEDEIMYHRNLNQVYKDQLDKLTFELTQEKNNYKEHVNSLRTAVNNAEERECKSISKLRQEIEAQKIQDENLLKNKIKTLQDEFARNMDIQKRLNEDQYKIQLEKQRQEYDKRLREELEKQRIDLTIFKEQLESQNKAYESVREKLVEQTETKVLIDNLNKKIMYVRDDSAKKKHELINEHRKTVKSLENSIINLEDELSKVQSEFSDSLLASSEEIQKLKTENMLLKEDIEKQRMELLPVKNAKNELLYQLNTTQENNIKEIDNLKNHIKQLMSEKCSLEQVLRRQEEVLRNLQQPVNMQSGVREDQEEVIESLKEKIKELENQIQVIEDENDRLAIRCSDSEVISNQLKDANNKLTKDENIIRNYETMYNSCEEYKKVNEELVNDLNRVKSQLEQDKKSLNELQILYQGKLMECKQLNEDVNTIREQMQEILTENKGISQSAEQYEVFIKEMKRKNFDNKRDIELKDAEIKRLECELLESQGKANHLEELIKNLKGELSKSQLQMYTNNESINNVWQSKLRVIKEDLLQFKSECELQFKDFEDKLAKLKSFISQKQDRTKVMEEKLEASETTLKGYNELNRKIEREFSIYIDESKVEPNEIAINVATNMNLHIKELGEKLKAYEDEIEVMKETIRKDSEKIDIMINERNNKQSLVEHLELTTIDGLNIVHIREEVIVEKSITELTKKPIKTDNDEEMKVSTEGITETRQGQVIEMRTKDEPEELNENINRTIQNVETTDNESNLSPTKIHSWLATIFLTERDLDELQIDS